MNSAEKGLISCMKTFSFARILFAGMIFLSSQALAERVLKHRLTPPSRFDTNVSNDSDRNRDIRNERIADFKRAQERHNDAHRYYNNGGYYRGGYSGAYYGYAPYYYGPGSSIAIGVGSGYYDTGYNGTYYRDDDRPVYRGRELPESGSSSVGVSVQRKLARLGYYKGEIDGDIGPASRRAILRYQRDNDLAQTGRIDRNLVSALGVS